MSRRTWPTTDALRRTRDARSHCRRRFDAYLRTRPEIDSTHLGLLGHSEGAIIAPIVALEDQHVVGLVTDWLVRRLK